MSFDFKDLVEALGGNEFEETPVMLREFVQSKDYLGLPPLSENQYKIIEASTQIYKHETLLDLYGLEEGEKRWKQTYTEVIMQLGKGSGKDFMSTVACAYIVYLLLCLKDPSGYYGKPTGDSIDLLNIAINADQAKNVFFKNFKKRIKQCPWFLGKYRETADNMTFDKDITVHSAHSERESWEGYNTMLVVLDEIAGFAAESTSGEASAKTAEAIYDMYRTSVDSRFPNLGKVLLLSFPRYKDDYIQTKYKNAVMEEEIQIKSHTFLVNPELGDFDDNRLTIEWEEPQVISYRQPGIFALKRPTWEINPTVTLESQAGAFIRDRVNALARLACMPPDALDALFKSREKVEGAFRVPNLAVDEQGRFAEWFKPEDKKEYYIHVDLAQKHDRCAVAMAHVDAFAQMKVSGEQFVVAPKIVVDFVMYWTPSSDKSVDFTEVKNFILDVKRRGFNIRLVTFDRWNSHEMMEALKEHGLKTELLSVAKKHYDDMALVVAEDRLVGPNIKILIEELLKLQIIKDKVDHPRRGSKDLADAVCGAVYNTVALTNRFGDDVIEVHTYKSLGRDNYVDKEQDPGRPGQVIKAPEGASMPDEIKSFLDGMRVL